jgi:hypothetical protein
MNEVWLPLRGSSALPHLPRGETAASTDGTMKWLESVEPLYSSLRGGAYDVRNFPVRSNAPSHTGRTR